MTKPTNHLGCHSALPELINGGAIPAFVGVLTRELNDVKMEPKTCDDAQARGTICRRSMWPLLP